MPHKLNLLNFHILPWIVRLWSQGLTTEKSTLDFMDYMKETIYKGEHSQLVKFKEILRFCSRGKVSLVNRRRR